MWGGVGVWRVTSWKPALPGLETGRQHTARGPAAASVRRALGCGKATGLGAVRRLTVYGSAA
eukprot:362607-Chlamydomonas_euryale.AAC.28